MHPLPMGNIVLWQMGVFICPVYGGPARHPDGKGVSNEGIHILTQTEAAAGQLTRRPISLSGLLLRNGAYAGHIDVG